MLKIEIKEPLKEVKTTQDYMLILVDADHTRHFFDKNGEYDGVEHICGGDCDVTITKG